MKLKASGLHRNSALLGISSGIVVYREAVTAFELLGMAAILGSILLLNYPTKKK